MEVKKIMIIIIILLIVITPLLNFISAAQIGISPAEINFKNVLRGGYSQRTVIISTDSVEPIPAKLSARGEIVNWLNFSKLNFTISKNNPYLLVVSVTPPSDTPNGNYTGYIRVEANQQSGTSTEGKATSVVLPVIDLSTNVEVTDQEYFECRATDYKINSIEEGEDIVFSTKIRNLGNVKINPEIKIDIWDENQIEILKSKSFSAEDIKPTTEKEIVLKMDSTGLKTGQYWAEISTMDCYSSQLLTFDILEKGALRANGVLDKILSNPWVSTGDTTLIEALFRNTGEKDVDARFKGQITYNGKIIQILESEETSVPIDNQTKFQFYFTPKKPGRYVVSGRIFGLFSHYK